MFTTFDRVKELSQKRGISLSKLEETLGLGKNSIYALKRNQPSAENTTQLNFEYLSLNIKLIDDQGTTVDTQPIYENNWAANEKRNLEFITNKTFSTIQITVNDYSLED